MLGILRFSRPSPLGPPVGRARFPFQHPGPPFLCVPSDSQGTPRCMAVLSQGLAEPPQPWIVPPNRVPFFGRAVGGKFLGVISLLVCLWFIVTQGMEHGPEPYVGIWCGVAL